MYNYIIKFVTYGMLLLQHYIGAKHAHECVHAHTIHDHRTTILCPYASYKWEPPSHQWVSHVTHECAVNEYYQIPILDMTTCLCLSETATSIIIWLRYYTADQVSLTIIMG